MTDRSAAPMRPAPWRSALLYTLLASSIGSCAASAPDSGRDALATQARQAGAIDVAVERRADGGLRLGGELQGHQFALVFPAHWNKQAVLFERGYSTPGSKLAVDKDPVATDKSGFFKTPYAQGFAVGLSAYDKAGLGVQSAVVNTYRLEQFVGKLGATRNYWPVTIESVVIRRAGSKYFHFTGLGCSL